MIKLRNEHDDYIFIKMIDDEYMSMSMVNRIDTIGDQTNHTTNVKADCTLSLLKYPEFQRLQTIVEDFCKESSEEIQLEWWGHHSRNERPVWNESYIQSQYCNAMWGTRSVSGEITTPHDHWPTTWSFCYYIDPPEGCSNLYFPTLDYELEIEHGKLVIFRSHLIHETVSLPFKGHRYCVAGTVVSNPPRTLS